MTTRAILGVAVIAGSLMAHHSLPAVYSDRLPVTLSGPVTKFDWVNPHVWVHVETPQGNWAVEFASRTELRRAKWSAQTLKVGDVVTIAASAAIDRSRKAHGKAIKLADGTELKDATSAVVARMKSRVPVPRWPNGHVRLGPEPGKAGYWANPSKAAMYETSAGNLRMSADGILTNISDVGKVAPFQPWAKALYEYRQKTLLKDDPMAACLPAGGPRQFQAPFGVQILEDPDRQRVFVMSRGSNRNWRNIDLDGRPLPNGADVTPTFFGYSVGKWEGDTLVVQTTGLAERFWFSNGGVPHSESAKLTERISRPDYDTLRYEVTVDDPGTYTRPWKATWDLQWIPDDEIDEYYCDDDNREK